jgi:hypothetical protein
MGLLCSEQASYALASQLRGEFLFISILLVSHFSIGYIWLAPDLLYLQDNHIDSPKGSAQSSPRAAAGHKSDKKKKKGRKYQATEGEDGKKHLENYIPLK